MLREIINLKFQWGAVPIMLVDNQDLLLIKGLDLGEERRLRFGRYEFCISAPSLNTSLSAKHLFRLMNWVLTVN